MNYIDLAIRTAKMMDTPAQDFAHAALGLVDESYELATSQSDENTLEELGDLCWFVALASHTLHIDAFSQWAGMHEEDRSHEDMVVMVPHLGEHAAIIAGAAKKWMVSGKQPSDTDTYRLARMVDLIASIGEQNGWTLAYIQDANIRKLAARYPDGFTDWHANNRDVDGEMNALRGES